MKQLKQFLLLFLLSFFSQLLYSKNYPKNQTIYSYNEMIAAGGIGDFFRSIGEFIGDLSRPVWGEYKVNGQNDAAPLGMFNRLTFTKDTTEIINQIKIIGSDFNRIYKNIYENGTVDGAFSIPAKNGSRTVYENRATFAKNAAFVLLLGVNETGERISKGLLDTLAANVLTVLKECDDNIGDNWFWKEGFTGWGEDAQLVRSMELINYCIALDLVRTAGYGWNTDRGHNDNPKSAIKKHAYLLYKFSNRPFNTLSNVLNNNLTIVTSASLITAAISLHNEKDLLTNFNRHPRLWAKVGHIRIRESEFTAFHHSQSKKGGKYGHQEGPGYYAKAMKEGVIPMSIFFDNFVNNNKNFERTYLSGEDLFWGLFGLFFLAENIKNYQHDPDWKNTFYWYRDIIQPNGFAPSFDDTRINVGLPTMACLKDPKLSLLKGPTLLNSFNDSYNDRADFLAANNPAEPFERSVNFANSLSGDAVFRTEILTENFDSISENNQHYAYINSKRKIKSIRMGKAGDIW